MPPGNHLLYQVAEAVFGGRQFDDRSHVARELGTTPSSVAPWAQRLAFHRVMRDTADGLQFDEDRFLAYLTSLRVATLQPEPPFNCPLSPEDALDRLRGTAFVTCMFTAGNSWAFYEPRRDLHVYVERRSLSHIRSLLPRTRRAAGQETRVQLYVESLHHVPHQDRQRRPVTTPLFTTVDLRAHPEGGAHAEFLRRNLLPRLRGRSS